MRSKTKRRLHESESQDQSEHKIKTCESGLTLLKESHEQNYHSQKELGTHPQPPNQKTQKKTNKQNKPHTHDFYNL